MTTRSLLTETVLVMRHLRKERLAARRELWIRGLDGVASGWRFSGYTWMARDSTMDSEVTVNDSLAPYTNKQWAMHVVDCICMRNALCIRWLLTYFLF